MACRRVQGAGHDLALAITHAAVARRAQAQELVELHVDTRRRAGEVERERVARPAQIADRDCFAPLATAGVSLFLFLAMVCNSARVAASSDVAAVVLILAWPTRARA